MTSHSPSHYRDIIARICEQDDDEEDDLEAMDAEKHASDEKRRLRHEWNNSAYNRWQQRVGKITLPLKYLEFLAPYPISLVRGDKDGQHQREIEVIATIKGRLDEDSYEYLGMVDAFIPNNISEPPLTSREMKWIAGEISEDEYGIQDMLNSEYRASPEDWSWVRHPMDPRGRR